MARTPKIKVQRVACAYAPDSGKTICPHCFSIPSLAKRVEHELAGHRGWTRNPSGIPGVSNLKYPCGNPACPTEVIVSFLDGYVGAEAVAPFRKKQTLRGPDAKRFATGTIGKDGIWRVKAPTAAITPPPAKKPAPKKSPSPPPRRTPKPTKTKPKQRRPK
jgi:hypothetical protein